MSEPQPTPEQEAREQLRSAAMASLAKAIVEFREPPRGFQFVTLDLSREPPQPTPAEQLEQAVHLWLVACRESARALPQYEYATRYIWAKGWLRALVGWDAVSELGQAAGRDGYDRLWAEYERILEAARAGAAQ